MDIDEIKEKVRNNQYVYSYHAEIERKADTLTFVQVEAALLNSCILEQYADTGRGESCLVVGFASCGVWLARRKNSAYHRVYSPSTKIS